MSERPPNPVLDGLVSGVISGQIKIVTSAYVPKDQVFMMAPGLTEEEERRIQAAGDKYIAEGMEEKRARLLALAESGKVAALHLHPDTLKDPPW